VGEKVTTISLHLSLFGMPSGHSSQSTQSQDCGMQNFIAFGRRPQVTGCYVAEVLGSISVTENHLSN